MTVEEFGIGFPPRIFGWKSKKGTLWSVNVIPLGGFVKIKGESDGDIDAPDSFASQRWGKRFAVVIAGVVMNLVLAWVLFSVGFFFGLPSIVEDGVDDSAIVSDRTMSIVEILPGSAADLSGLDVGDRLLTIDNVPYTSGSEARAALVPHSDASPISLMIVRHGETQTIAVTPMYVEALGREGIGVAIVETGFVRYPWYVAPGKGFLATVTSTRDVIAGFAGLITGLFGGSDVAANLSGPVGIAVLTGQVASLGVSHLVQFAAMLSVNLAVINIVPFPALDGGRLVFLWYEVIRKKRATPAFEQGVHAIGFAALLILVFVVTIKDVIRLFL
jgi:regulator of sigma E protease